MKERFTTTIDQSLIHEFKDKCLDRGIKKYNEVIEALIYAYVHDEIDVEVKTLYKVKMKNFNNVEINT